MDGHAVFFPALGLHSGGGGGGGLELTQRGAATGSWWVYAPVGSIGWMNTEWQAELRHWAGSELLIFSSGIKIVASRLV